MFTGTMSSMQLPFFASLNQLLLFIAPDDVRTEMAKIVGQLSEMYR